MKKIKMEIKMDSFYTPYKKLKHLKNLLYIFNYRLVPSTTNTKIKSVTNRRVKRKKKPKNSKGVKGKKNAKTCNSRDI